MNLYQFSYDLPLYIWLISIVLIVFIVYKIYSKTKPVTHATYFKLLVSLRSLIVILLFSLIFHPIIKEFESKNVNNKVHLFIDKSNSMTAYFDQLDSLKSEIEDDLKQKEMNYTITVLNEKENVSDFISPLNTLNSDINDISIVLTDGNQSTDIPHDAIKNRTLILPVGKKTPKDFISIEKLNLNNELTSIKELRQLTASVKAYKLVNKSVSLRLKINDTMVLDKSIILSNGMSTLDLTNNFESKDSIFKLELFVNKEIFKTNLKLTNNRKRVLHIFDSPNIEAKFIKFAITKLNEIELRSFNINQFDYSDLNNSDFIILSGDLSTNYFLNLQEALSKKNIPILIITDQDFKFPHLGLKKINFQQKEVNDHIQVNNKTFPLFHSFYRKALFHFADFPKLSFKTIKDIDISNSLEYKSFFNSNKNEFLLLFRSKKSKNVPFVLLNSSNFWTYHLTVSNELDKNQNYSDLVNYIYKTMISENNNLIKININPKEVISYESLNYSIETYYDDNSPIEFDYIDIKVKHNNRDISNSRFPFISLGRYTHNFEIPEKGRVNIELKSYLNGIEQFKKTVSYPIITMESETRNPYVNDVYLELLAEKNNIDLLSIDNVKQSLVQNTRIDTKSKLLKLYFNKSLMYVLLLLIAFEWFLRKKKQLL